MEIVGEDYSIKYDPVRQTIFFQGILRLEGSEGYVPILEFLNSIIDSGTPVITINLKELELLNSSGITTLSRFVIRVRQEKNVQLIFYGSQNIFWHERSLGNLQRLLPTMQIYLE